MRETFGMLLQTSRDAVIDDGQSAQNTNLSSTDTFLKREINTTNRALFSLLKEYGLQPPPQTALTEEDQTYYHFPPGLVKLEGVTLTVGTTAYPLRVVNSQDEWNQLQQFPTGTVGIPTRYFPRRDDVGLYPTPQEDAQTLTFQGNYQPVNMSAEDYSDGTVVATINSRSVVGTNTAFTSAMIGRWFALVDTNSVATSNWYRISGVPDGTTLTLETYFEDATSSGASYVLGESPEVPSELHMYIPYRAAAIYYALRRKETTHAAKLMNFYYTGDYDDVRRKGTMRAGVLSVLQDFKQNGRSNSQMHEMGGDIRRNIINTDVWGITLGAP